MNAVSSMHDVMCPRCGRFVSEHDVVDADLNVMKPNAALWPHMDEHLGVRKGRVVTALVLLQPATAGGQLRVSRAAGEDGVAWRSMSSDAITLARRSRDTMLVPLFSHGDACVMHGERFVHEVTRIRGDLTRVTLVLTLKC